MKTCPICKKEFEGYGHNPWPITSMIQSYVGGECCDVCNNSVVTPSRSLVESFNGIFDKIVALRGE